MKKTGVQKISLVDAAHLLGNASDYFGRDRSLDTTEQLLTELRPHSWRRPGLFAKQRILRKCKNEGTTPTLKRVFDIIDVSLKSRSGVMVLAVSDLEDGRRQVLATIESTRLTGIHDSFIRMLMAKAFLVDADVLKITTTSAATRLAAIDTGFVPVDKSFYMRQLLSQIGTHVAHAIDLDVRYENDAPSALAMWREGCAWVVFQLNSLLPYVSGGDSGCIVFNEESFSIDIYDAPDSVGATLAAMSRLDLVDLRNVKIAGSLRGPSLPVSFVDGYDSGWNHIAACVPFVGSIDLQGAAIIDLIAGAKTENVDADLPQ